MPHLNIAAPVIPTGEMARLHSLGLSLVPLGSGKDGKSPLVRFGDTPRLPLKRVLAPMHRTGSACYGIRLEGLAVIDCDDDSPALVDEMESRFGVSPVHVQTPRGRHIYYRASKGNFPNLRAEGLPVDIKRGPASYVVGPRSVRPDGGVYLPSKGVLGECKLPTLQPIAPSPRLFTEGNRNRALTQDAIQMVELVDGQDELLSNLKYVRDEDCASPHTIFDAELSGIAEWAWKIRLEGNVYQGRSSQFRLQREAIYAIRIMPNASDAIALFVTLQDLHGHLPAKTFALQAEAMRAAGHTDLSRDRFLAARRNLEATGLLRVAANHQAGKSARTYRLNRMRPEIAVSENVIGLSQSQTDGGRGLSLTYVDGIPSKGKLSKYGT